MAEQNYFEVLNAVNVNEHTELKNKLTYLSWAFAWQEFKKKFPLSFFTIYENENGWNYFTDGKTCWVKTGVTVVLEDGTHLEHIEYLPVMNYRNDSIPLEDVTSKDVNTSIQRSLTKAVARHGLGLYIYAGEDLPSDEKEAQKKAKITASEVKSITAFAERKGIKIETVLKQYEISTLEEMNAEQYVNCLKKFNATPDKKGE